jgi:hypothetical protein
MRVIVFKDLKIPEASYRQLLAEYSDFIQENTTIEPVFFTHDYDYTDYPTDVDGDGDDVPRPTMLQAIADNVTKRYGEWGADHIVTLIHDDNWKSGATTWRKGISGTNYSYRFNNYHLQYVRWWNRKGKSEKQEMINRFGTLNHEQYHAVDALIKQEIGIEIDPILGVEDFDWDVVHGEHPDYDYVNYNNNAQTLKILAPYLIAAYEKRLERHKEAVMGKQRTIIGLLQQLVYLLTKRKNRKNGVKVK